MKVNEVAMVGMVTTVSMAVSMVISQTMDDASNKEVVKKMTLYIKVFMAEEEAEKQPTLIKLALVLAQLGTYTSLLLILCPSSYSLFVIQDCSIKVH